MAAISTETNLELDPEGLKVLGSMERATPGESLTGNPDEPKAWEQAPEFTNMREALDYIVDGLMKEDVFLSITDSIRKGIPISDVVQQILYVGFTEGKWNPDLMILLAEPLAFMLMALAERQGIDYVINRDDAEDEAEDERKLSTTGIEKRLKEKQQAALQGRVSTLPPAIVERIEEVPIVESLLAEQEEPETTPDSLLGQQGA